MECFLSAMLATWILSTSFVTYAAAQAFLGPTIQVLPLWCLFCRSDKDPACINKASDHEIDFTKPCNNETMYDFWKDIKYDPPERPVIAPRSGSIGQERFVCYRVFTVDQSFTFRTCTITTDLETAEEACNPCTFQNKRAKCCVCSETNCNIKNSDATWVFKQWSWTFMYFLAGFSLFIPCTL